MRKQIQRVIAVLSVAGVILGASTNKVSACEEMCEEKALPEQVVAIASGSDDIYGPGAYIDHDYNPKARFNSGGYDHTHQYIVAQVLTILNHDCGDSIFNTEKNAEILLTNTDWPDVYGNETDYATFAGHFYNPDTNKNWLGTSSPTARTRAESYFEKAVDLYQAGDVEGALTQLGRGSHYVSDLNEPHHASNLTTLNSNHTEFETYVDEQRMNFTISGNQLASEKYSDALNQNVGELCYHAAKAAKALADKAQNVDTYYEAGNASVQNAITTVAQYYYKFAKEVGIY